MKYRVLCCFLIMRLVALIAVAPVAEAAAPGYTGLIIVVRDFPLNRSMSPAVLTPSGRIVYGRGWWKPGTLNPQLVDVRGIVEYVPSVQAATRTGPRPLVVRAIDVSGPPLSNINTDVIITERDAARIRAADAQGRFLERLQVTFVVAPTQAY